MAQQATTTGTATSRARLARKAVRKQTRARLALSGPSGSGKTWTALSIARIIAPGKPVVVIDTEPGDASQGAATLYADHFEFDAIEWVPPFDPRDLTLTIQELGRDYPEGVLIIDSASHFWRGPGGTLDIADGRFGGWKSATPAQDSMIDAILRSPMHAICCTRAKQSYEVEQDQNGKQTVKKLGLAPIQRDDLEYEFQVVATLDVEHRIDVGKTRAAPLAGLSFPANDQDRFAHIYADWLVGGVVLARQIELDAIKVAMRLVAVDRQKLVGEELREMYGPASSLTEETLPGVWAVLAAELSIDPHPFVEDGEDGLCGECHVPAVVRWHSETTPPPPKKKAAAKKSAKKSAKEPDAPQEPPTASQEAVGASTPPEPVAAPPASAQPPIPPPLPPPLPEPSEGVAPEDRFCEDGDVVQWVLDGAQVMSPRDVRQAFMAGGVDPPEGATSQDGLRRAWAFWVFGRLGAALIGTMSGLSSDEVAAAVEVES